MNRRRSRRILRGQIVSRVSGCRTEGLGRGRAAVLKTSLWRDVERHVQHCRCPERNAARQAITVAPHEVRGHTMILSS